MVRQLVTLLRLIRIHPAYFAIPLVLALLAAGFEGISMALLLPMLQGFLQQDYSFITELPVLSSILNALPDSIDLRDRTLFLFLVGAFFLSTIFRNLTRYASAVTMGYLSTRAEHHLRKYLFEAYLRLGQEYFDASSVGHHSTIILRFTQQAIAPFMMLSRLMQAVLPLGVYMLVMFGISWRLTLAVLPLFWVLAFSMRYVIRNIQRLSSSVAEAIRFFGKNVVEILSSVSLVRTSQTEYLERERYTALSDRSARLEFKKIALQQLIIPLQELITLAAGVLLLAAMLFLMINDQGGDGSQFIVYAYVLLNASTKFSTLTSVRGELAMVSAPIETILRIFEDSKGLVVPSGTKEFHGLTSSIEFRDAHFAYAEGAEVLQGMSFTALQGETTAIVGPTGAGKSTIFNLLLRLYDCRPGSIFFDGTDIRSYSTSSLLSRIALVSQDVLLLNESLRHNITYGIDTVSEHDLARVLDQARLRELIERLPDGIDTPVGDRGTKLSGGEKQRIAIARALLKGADIFLLDEATSALDAETEHLVQSAIHDVTKGKTVIVIAHRLQTIKNAEKIVVIKGGRNVEAGSFDALIEAKGRFHSYWQAQQFS